MMISLSKLLKENQWNQIVALLLLLLLLGLGGVPGYLTGKWQWKELPPISSLKELRQIRKTGLNLPGWETIEQNQAEVGEKKWSFQVIKKKDPKAEAILLLFPQNSPKNKPEVEWSEINGWGRLNWGKWDIAQYRSAEFIVKQASELGSKSDTKVEARFFRASTPQQTFAVLQWYAWPSGGHSSPLHWFVTDQLAQWHKQRTPWVGVSILIPIEPLGNIETAWSLAQSLGSTVQESLIFGIRNS